MRHFTLLLLLAACSKPEAYIECRSNGATIGDGMACSIEHRAGSGPLHVCWTLQLACANGLTGFADSCGDVQPKSKAAIVVQYAAFQPTLDKCDRVSGANVLGTRIVER